MKFRRLLCVFLSLLTVFAYTPAKAISGDMGTGIPSFGIYSNVTGGPTVIVWGLDSPSTPYPTGCSYLWFTPGLLGPETYAIFVGVLTTARINRKAVRFYSHANITPGPGGSCQIDYIQLWGT